MGRTARNQLHLVPHGAGWRLYGRILGRKIRAQSENIAELEAKKAALENQLAEAGATRRELRHTTLTPAQLADAEAAVLRAGGRSLLDCVIAAERVLTTGGRVGCESALADWLQSLRDRRRRAPTLAKNEARVRAFLAHAGQPRDLQDITPTACERWVLRTGTQGYTALTDAAVLRAWLRHCIRRRWILLSPLELDMRDLAESARSVAPAAILTPAQARALLNAAETHADGVLAPYVALACWCFLRHAEVLRTTEKALHLRGRLALVEVVPLKRRTASYRTVSIPACVRGVLASAMAQGRLAGGVFYSRTMFETVRAKAGLVRLAPAQRHGRRRILGGVWQENILRHTGISYHFAQGGDIKDTTRQAGNSDATAFRHYLALASRAGAREFYRR